MPLFLLRYLPLVALLAIPPAFAGEDPYAGAVPGRMAGLRDSLSEEGVELALVYKADLWAVTSGGLKRGGNYMDNLDTQFAIDGEKLLGIKGNTAFLAFINNEGGKTNETRVGGIQGIDNIETPSNGFRLYEAWVDQQFFEDRLAVLAGLRDLNAEFDVTDMTANFIMPTMQFGQAVAQSGVGGPPVFPFTALGARVKFLPRENSYVMLAAFDGIPGNPSHPHGTHIDLEGGDGLLLIAEAGCTPDNPEGVDGVRNIFGIGGWMYTRQMDDLVQINAGGEPVKRYQAGLYLLSSYEIYHNPAGRALGAFFRAGIADGNTAQTDWDYETGLVASGWMPTRPEGEIGIGLSQAHNGDAYIRFAGGAADRNEYSIELYYRDYVAPGLILQPDLQYIINPGTDPAIRNATVIGLRFEITL